MRFVSMSLIVLAVAAPAAADPMPPCPVTIARAPDDVRVVVEHWLRSEPRCTQALEVRIIRTDGGLYLLARDARGHERERIVPDAQAAGVLIASWAAEDVAPAPPGATPTQPESPPVASPESTPGFAPPSATPPVGAAPVVAVATAPESKPSRWLGAGGMISMQDGGGGGVRAELDLKRWTRWSIGAAGSISETMHMVSSSGYMETSDLKAVAYIAREAQFGRWQVRTAVGVGAVYTTGHAVLDFADKTGSGVFPTGEVSLILGRELGRRWALHAGPLVTGYLQRYSVSGSSMPGSYQSHSWGRGLDLMMFAGARYRL